MITESSLKKEIDRQEGLLKTCGAIISSLPAGNLVCKNRNGRCALYRSVKENGRAIQHSLKQQGADKELTEELKYKRCLIKVESKVRKNVIGMKRLSECYHDLNIESIENEISPGIKGEGWSFAEYDLSQRENSLLKGIYKIKKHGLTGSSLASGNPDYRSEDLKINTGMGFSVRSKSELLICIKLKEYGLDFKYEHSLRLGMINIHPDFTIIFPDGNFVLWEHFGRMDDANYKRMLGSKLKSYADNGYFPNYNLFMTYENLENPLDTESIEQVIEKILLRNRKFEM